MSNICITLASLTVVLRNLFGRLYPGYSTGIPNTLGLVQYPIPTLGPEAEAILSNTG